MNITPYAELVGAVAGSLLSLLAVLRFFFSELKLHLREEFATKQDFQELRNDIKEALQARSQPDQSLVAARKVRRALKSARHAESEEVSS